MKKYEVTINAELEAENDEEAREKIADKEFEIIEFDSDDFDD